MYNEEILEPSKRRQLGKRHGHKRDGPTTGLGRTAHENTPFEQAMVERMRAHVQEETERDMERRHYVEQEIMGISKEPQMCQCGCGRYAKHGYLPGHEAKRLRGLLRK